MEGNQEIMRHSCSHLLASAVQNLYPGTKFAIGPAIEDGFYYDFDLPNPISEEDLPKIEAEMTRIKKASLVFDKEEREIGQAIDQMKELDQPYKLALLEDLQKKGEAKVSFYHTGDFVDLCRGPHVASTKEIGAFKLTAIAGAYWRGSEKNKMLTRIYGICFPSPQELEEHLAKIEEAKKRDHRKIGKELDLFTIDEEVGPGLILWHPKLSLVREIIENYWREEHRKRGYEYVYTPHIGQVSLWETSGHTEHYLDNMFPVMERDDTQYLLKPMNCPFHIKVYKTRPRSYRELPLRWCELGTVYRYEESGVLHGMLRVRGFTQDDAHIFCREDQFVEELEEVLNFAVEMNDTFGFNKLHYELSVRDPNQADKYVGDSQTWDKAEKTLKEILDKRGIEYSVGVGEAKFYGPAIDLKAEDCLGRLWQGTTIQLDFNLPQRFAMTYVGEDGQEHQPIMIHRTLLGAMGRFIGTLIEQYAGAFPVWLAPVQARIIPIADRHLEYAQTVAKSLREDNIRVDIDQRNETMQARIRDAQLEKIPYMLILGDKEIQDTQNIKVSVRVRNGQDLGSKGVKEVKQIIKEQIDSKKLEL